MRYEMINYDVWGNRREGFWVNQAFRTGTFVEIPDDASDAEIIRILRREGILKKGVRTSSVRIDGETGHALYFEHAPSSRPEFELRAVEESFGRPKPAHGPTCAHCHHRGRRSPPRFHTKHQKSK